MSKLFLLICLIGFFSINDAHALTGEDKIKINCLKQSGGNNGGRNINSPYQRCLRYNGIIRVERNLSNEDISKTDARVCNASDPICRKCIDLHFQGTASTARTRITQCIQNANAAQRRSAAQAAKSKQQPKAQAARTPRTPRTPTPVVAPVTSGTATAAVVVECKAEDNKVLNSTTQSCDCMAGFEDRLGIGPCVRSAGPPVPTVDACIVELQNRVNSCNTAATTAISKCDAETPAAGGTDTVSVLQGLLGAANSNTQAQNAGTGALDNCVKAGVASTTGYYALGELRTQCRNEIESCKSSCSDAISYIAANKETVYQACRQRAYDTHQGALSSPYRSFTTVDAFNLEWDQVNRASFENQMQTMEASIVASNAECEDGTAVANQNKISGFMGDMNASAQSANQCQCQLGSGSTGQDCSVPIGPAECAANPSLTGCAQATVNCLNPSDTSQKCVCFRNPNSNECKNPQQANNNLKINSTEVSAFAGLGATVGGGITGNTTGKTEVGNIAVGDLSGLGSDGETLAGGTSGTTTADGGSPFGTAAGASAGGGGSSAGGSADGTASTEKGEDDGSSKKSIGGMFDIAKSALSSLLKKGSGDKNSFDEANKNSLNGANQNGLDSKKWRPRGMVRGLASDTEIAGKFEDIWKVMNKQYKIQDQKDSFIFGGEKK